MSDLNKVSLDILMHYGMPRRSGRYPWGSGEHPYQHSGDFLSRVEKMKADGFTFTDKDGKTWTGETAIAKWFGLSSTEFRIQKQLAGSERRASEAAEARRLRNEGKSLDQIAQIMGYKNDSSIRSLLDEGVAERKNKSRQIADYLKAEVDKNGMLDVGKGTELSLGVSKEKLREALYILEREGYPNYGIGLPQATNPGQQTPMIVLCPPGTEHREAYNIDKINFSLSNGEVTSDDGGETFRSLQYPKSMDSNRLMIRYAEDGGKLKDGVIELRPNVPDLDLETKRYAQVRILVDDDHYLKGMAVYGQEKDFPPGVDVIFNTNKGKDKTKMEVLKKIDTKDPNNPFGTLLRANGQSTYTDENGKEQLSLINRKSDEGDWGDWSNKIPSQFLGKQRKELVHNQLKLTLDEKRAELEEIEALTNPTVKRKLLLSYADDCDSEAVHLKAMALPGQQYHVILPLTSISDTQVYAPNYKDGETVALVRYPHAGTFEIPILTVNNKNREAQRVIGKNAPDAVGISAAVAERLSGADFDGDTVTLIPCNSSSTKTRIKSTPPLKGLEGFDPKDVYGKENRPDPNFKRMTKGQTSNEMGKISNLITDMTLKGATDEELAAAVRHSMVVIDAHKHELDYKASYIDNNIEALKRKYQRTLDDEGKEHFNASTLLSRSKSQVSVPRTKGSGKIDPETGEMVYKLADTYVDRKTGKVIQPMQKSTQMAETKDAMLLSSGTVIENEYGNYANTLKSLGNTARKESLSVGKIEYSRAANEKYQPQVQSLKNKLTAAKANAPRERQAQALTNTYMKMVSDDNPDLTKAERKKIANVTLKRYRDSVGAKRSPVDITPDEWEAIQSGAISTSMLSEILDHTNIDTVRKYATPRTVAGVSNSQKARIQALARRGYTNAQIADAVGVSVSTVQNVIKQ